MIYSLFQYLDPNAETFLRLGFRFISSRAGLAFLFSLTFVLIFLPRSLTFFSQRGWVNRQRNYMMDASSKEGIPVMGGMHIFSASMASILLFCNPMNHYTQVALLASVVFFSLGLIDDLLKIKAKHHDQGVSRSVKYLVQGGFGCLLALWVLSDFSPHPEAIRGTLSIPFYKSLLPISFFYIPFVVFMVVLISNSVNFADGMDGLATGPSFMTFLGLGIFAYILGNVIWSQHFLFFHIRDIGIISIQSSELVIVCSAVLGALIGFLWYNTYPATIFMGDCGSMFLGGLMATIFVLLKQEFLFPIFGLLFILEIVSVFIQDWIGIKLLGRRILYRAPYHEYLKYLGYSEPKIVVRMWILSAAAMAIGLMSIKMR